MDGSNGLEIDAVPQQIPVVFVENETNKFKIENLLSEFCFEDYKSAFFLLMDYVGIPEFLSLTQKNESYLKDKFITLYYSRLNESLLVELLGTLKMYKKLRTLGTCCHVYKSKETNYNRIHGIWKVLYSLCEELTDDDLDILKQQYVQPDLKDQILSAEDWFCWALQKKLFSKTTLFHLEDMFRNYPKCLSIIKSYKDFGLYDVRIPTAASDCGIALIFNYDKFNENSGLPERKNSYKDVASLKLLWETYGFQVKVYPNLTSEQTFEVMNKYSSLNYSNHDVFVCCILSHGESNAVYSVNGELIKITDLVAPVVKCVSLNKKPKLFFIQACQGPNIHGGIGKPIYQIRTNNNKRVEHPYPSPPPPVLCDTLIVCSSIDGYVSFNDNEGSWFMQSLCKQMMEDGENSSIEEVMTSVHEEVRNKYSANLEPFGHSAFQIVNRSSTLGKKLILKKRTK